MLKAKVTARKCSPKTRSSPKTFAKFLQTAVDLQKKRSSPTNSQIFHKICASKILFSQDLWRPPRRNCIADDLRIFSTGQKIVLSWSRGQGIFEDLQGSRPRPKTCPSRPRTSNCVLEDVLKVKDVLEDSISGHNHCFFLPMSQLTIQLHAITKCNQLYH